MRAAVFLLFFFYFFLCFFTVLDADIRPSMRRPVPFGFSSKTEIRMLEETVNLVVYKAEMKVVADFIMVNEGKTATIEVQFPDGYGTPKNDPPPTKPLLRNFEVLINNQPVSTSHSLSKETGNWFNFDATFPQNKKVPIRVSYSIPTKKIHYRTPPAHEFEFYGLLERESNNYILKTGANWKGTIGKATVILKLGNDLTKKHLTWLFPRRF